MAEIHQRHKESLETQEELLNEMEAVNRMTEREKKVEEEKRKMRERELQTQVSINCLFLKYENSLGGFPTSSAGHTAHNEYARSQVKLESLSKRTKSDDDDVVDIFACLAHYLAHSEFRVRSEDRLEIRV
jgi:hypothetical protein